MFDRRHKRTKTQNAREMLWPSMGWKRTARYVKHRVHRLPGSAYSIASGMACGAGVSFTPYFGCHFFLAMGWAWLVRGNMIASLIGTAFGNPITFPFLMLTSYNVGRAILSSFGFHNYINIQPEISFQYILDNFIVFAVGGTTCAIAFWPMVFIPMYFLIQSAKLARAKRLAYVRHKREKKHKGEAGGPLLHDHSED